MEIIKNIYILFLYYDDKKNTPNLKKKIHWKELEFLQDIWPAFTKLVKTPLTFMQSFALQTSFNTEMSLQFAL
jgi:hypothetical protein